MLYDNWIHKLSESYTNSHNINEEESGQHHPMVHKAAKYIHSVLDQYHRGHPIEKTLNSITGGLGGKEVTPDSVIDASDDAIRDHYGVEGHSYEVNDTVGGDHSEHRNWEGLIDNTVDSIKHHLSYHLDEPDKPEETEKKEVKESTLTESEMILEELNETKEYVNILEGVLNTLLENDIITEEDIVNIVEARSPLERYNQIFHLTQRSSDIDTADNAALEAEEKRRRDLETVDKIVKNTNHAGPDLSQIHAPFVPSADFGKHQRAGLLHAGSSEETGLIDRAKLGGIRPEDAEELADLQAYKHGIGEPTHMQINALRDLAKKGRERRAERNALYKRKTKK
jgi:hypothetical protein